jgi:hypothetical protein
MQCMQCLAHPQIALHFNHQAELAEIVRVLAEEKEKADDLDASTSVVFAFGATLVDKIWHCCQSSSKKKFFDADLNLNLARSKSSIRLDIEQAKAEKEREGKTQGDGEGKKHTKDKKKKHGKGKKKKHGKGKKQEEEPVQQEEDMFENPLSAAGGRQSPSPTPDGSPRQSEFDSLGRSDGPTAVVDPLGDPLSSRLKGGREHREADFDTGAEETGASHGESPGDTSGPAAAGGGTPGARLRHGAAAVRNAVRAAVPSRQKADGSAVAAPPIVAQGNTPLGSRSVEVPDNSVDIHASLLEDIQGLNEDTSIDQLARMAEYGSVAVQDLLLARLREDSFDSKEDDAGNGGTIVGAVLKSAVKAEDKQQLAAATDLEHHTIRTVNITAHAFARQLLTVDCDEGRDEPMTQHPLWGSIPVLPLPLQTTVATRRKARFDAAIDVILSMITEIAFHSQQNDGVGEETAVSDAARRQHSQLILNLSQSRAMYFAGNVDETMDAMDRFEAVTGMQGGEDAFEDEAFNLAGSRVFDDGLGEMAEMEAAAELLEAEAGDVAQELMTDHGTGISFDL